MLGDTRGHDLSAKVKGDVCTFVSVASIHIVAITPQSSNDAPLIWAVHAVAFAMRITRRITVEAALW